MVDKKAWAVVWRGVFVDLSRIIASSLRQKMLRELAKTREIQVMRLVSRVNSTYNELNRNLMIMEKEGIIMNEYRVKVRHGKVRVIRLNKDNPKTKALLAALHSLDDEK